MFVRFSFSVYFSTRNNIKVVTNEIKLSYTDGDPQSKCYSNCLAQINRTGVLN